MSELFYLGIMLFAGLLFGRLAKLIHLPNVTGYLVAGLVLGPFVTGVIPQGTVEGLDIVSDIALGFIAVSIGSEFKFSYFKRVGASPIVIAVLRALWQLLRWLRRLCCSGLTFLWHCFWARSPPQLRLPPR